MATPLGTLPLLCRVDDLLPDLPKFWMLRVVLLNPACGAVPLALEIHEVAWSAVHLTGEAVPESVKFRHFPQGTLWHLAYEFDPIGVNRLHISESGVEKECILSPRRLY